MKPIPLGKRHIGEGQPCFVIAEAGVNHGGDPLVASELIDAAADAGADAVKFQTFSPERLVSPDAPKATYQVRSTGRGTQAAMLGELTLSPDIYIGLKAKAEARGIEFLSSPFSEEDADFLQGLDLVAFKLGSGELTNTPLLRHVATYTKPMLLSTGMATENEVEAAVAAIGAQASLVLLHCVSAYPAPVEEVNLRAIRTLRERFGVPVGYSDHSLELEPGLGAVALGAVVVERHLTLDRSARGPDHAMSSLPEEFATYVASIRRLEAAMGEGKKVPAPSELDTARAARKSLFAARDVEEGHVLESE